MENVELERYARDKKSRRVINETFILDGAINSINVSVVNTSDSCTHVSCMISSFINVSLTR